MKKGVRVFQTRSIVFQTSQYWHRLDKAMLCFTITMNMPLQRTVAPDTPKQIVLDVRDKRKPQQTASPEITPHYYSEYSVYTVKVQSIQLLKSWRLVLGQFSEQKKDYCHSKITSLIFKCVDD